MKPFDSDAPPRSFRFLPADVIPDPGAGSDLVRAALRELERVHRAEFASLLRAAARIRSARRELGGLLARQRETSTSVRSWRGAARLALDLAVQDGLDLRGRRLLSRLASRPVRRWPAAPWIARAAARVADGEKARVALGFSLLSAGEAAGAARVFTQCLRALPRPRARGTILEGLGAAHADLGRLRLALGAFDQAADDPGSSVLALVSALHLSLVVGDVRRAARAAARLDLLVDSASPELAAALARLRSWANVFGAGLPWRPSNPCESLFQTLLFAPGSPAGRVCRALC